MIRKKRIQIEPEGVNAKRKTKTPAERLWLTRRMFLVKGSVVAGFTLLGARLAQLQILEHQDYQEQAADYTLRTKKEKAPRGLILPPRRPSPRRKQAGLGSARHPCQPAG